MAPQVHPDEEFWTASGGLDVPLHVRHLAVGRSYNGQGLGARMLHEAAWRAAQARRPTCD
ncbi:hypothetical protein [Micromonospora peucetia]|uniref:Acetyltransferase (GNAT) family protein n=1 Tax=Micromonospora peucetia TaxID=47871 RepID=A0ABZ1EL35_9ACTN|nr:hypothetical protein [Micromonospora peucetia]WSA34954.1 hypothetical protein OIE14_13345 [Micromonospora peucetia]